MGESCQRQLPKAAHPMPGWLAVYPIKLDHPSESGEEPTVERLEIPGLGVLLGVGMREVSIGVMGGIVIEVGPLPERLQAEEDMIVPYPNGATVYFKEDTGLPVGEYLYMKLTSVICWDPPPDKAPPLP